MTLFLALALLGPVDYSSYLGDPAPPVAAPVVDDEPVVSIEDEVFPPMHRSNPKPDPAPEPVAPPKAPVPEPPKPDPDADLTPVRWSMVDASGQRWESTDKAELRAFVARRNAEIAASPKP